MVRYAAVSEARFCVEEKLEGKERRKGCNAYIELDGRDALVYTSDDLLRNPATRHQQQAAYQRRKRVLDRVYVVKIKTITKFVYSCSDLQATR